MKLYQKIAHILVAIDNCKKSNNTEWYDRHSETLDKILASYLPHGSGFDRAVELDTEKSTRGKLYFTFGFHYMDSNGYYDGWEYYRLILSADLCFDFTLKIMGRDRNDSKSYFYDTFHEVFDREVTG